MKKLICFIFFVTITYSGFAQWQNTGGPVGGVNKVFVDGSSLFAAGYETFFRSNVEGQWQKINIGDKPVTVTCFTIFERKIYIGTQSSGIYYSSDGVNWTPIENNDQLQDSLSVSAIIHVGNKLLTNVYHYGSHGNHSRFYVFESEGKNLEQAVEFPSHLYVYSFKIFSGDKVLIATDKGIFIYDLSKESNPYTLLSNNPTIQIASTGENFYGVPWGVTNTLYKWNRTEAFDSWEAISIGLNEYITDLVLNQDTWYATTYNGVYKSNIFQDINNPWEKIDDDIDQNYLYVSNIAFSGDEKYVATNKGVFHSTNANTWNSLNENLATSYVYSAYVHNNYIYVATSNGLFKSPLINYNWSQLPDDNLKLPTYTSHFASIGNSIFVGTDQGIFKSSDSGNSWTNVSISLNYPSNYDSDFYSQWFNVKGLQALGNDLFTITYETPYITKNQGTTWTEISENLPDARIIKGLKIIADDFYLLLESYENVHDVWLGTLKTVIYKYNKSNSSWTSIKEFPQNTNFLNATPLGDELIYIFREDENISLNSINVKDLNIRTVTPPGKYFYNVFSIKGNLFITTYTEDYIEKNYISTDKGVTWKQFEELPDGVSSINTIYEDNGILYAGLSGNGIWARPYAQFFLPEVTIGDTSEVSATSANLSATVSSFGNFSVNAAFEYSENETLKPILGTIESNPKTITTSNVQVTATLDGLKGNTTYYYWLKATNSGNESKKSTSKSFSTKKYLEPDSMVQILSVEADPKNENKVTLEKTKLASLSLNQKIEGTEVKLHTKGLTRNDWQSINLSSSGKEYSAKLPHDQFDELGLEYFFSISPPSNYRDPNKPIIFNTDTVKVAIEYPEGLEFPYKLRFGKTEDDYNFISFPLSLDNIEIKDMLKDILGGNTDGEKSKWRLLTYVGNGGNFKQIWDEYAAGGGQAINVRPGRGYWLAVAEASEITTIKTGAGRTVVNYKSEDENFYFDKNYYYIKLKPGYNQLGNPFNYQVLWTDVLEENDETIIDELVLS